MAINVDQDAKTVGQMTQTAMELSQVTKDDEPIWINLSNVLYVAEQREAGASWAFV